MPSGRHFFDLFHSPRFESCVDDTRSFLGEVIEKFRNRQRPGVSDM
ncbi:hypothetical protein [Actinoplanes sp. NPDC020271]